MSSDSEGRDSKLNHDNNTSSDPREDVKVHDNITSTIHQDHEDSLNQDEDQEVPREVEVNEPVADKTLVPHINNNYKINGTIGTELKAVETNDKPALLPVSTSPDLPLKDVNKDVNPENVKSEKKGVRKFIDGVKADLVNKDLLPLKILFFFKYATLFVLYPFMPLHLKSLGLTATEAGINSGIIPIFVILAPPFSGVIADKIGNFKIFLTGLTVLNAPLALALLLVPKAREIVTLPDTLTLTFSCNPSPSSAVIHPFILRTLDSSICQIDSLNGSLDLSSIRPSALHCGTVCSHPDLAAADLPLFGVDANESSSYRLPDETSVFTPFRNRTAQLTCSQSMDCEYDLTSDPNEVGTTLRFQSLQLLNSPAGNVTHPTFGITMKGFSFGNTKFSGNEKPKCRNMQEKQSPNSSCRSECIVQINRTLICSNKEEEKVYNVALTFGLYTLLRIFLGVFSATSFIMFEGAVLAILKEFGGDYGLQRVTATLAAIIFAPLSGTLIQVFNNFYPAFYLYAVLQVTSGLITLKIDLRFKRPTEKILGHLKEVLTQVEILIFFAAMLLSGTSWGYLESFLFWFLEDLKASNVLMGLTISVGGLFGIPILILSRPIIKRFGHVNILCVGLLFYAIRLFGYSFIEDPWLCLPFEAMEAITASLAITAAATYAAALSSAQTIASIQGIWGGLYFGFGRGAGSLMGGYLMRWYGARDTFRIFSAMSLVGSILYFVVNLSYIERYSKHQRKTSGLNLSDIRGDRHKRALEENKESYDKVDGGYIGPCEVNFTDIPLDEETPPNKSKMNHSNVTNRKGDTILSE